MNETYIYTREYRIYMCFNVCVFILWPCHYRLSCSQILNMNFKRVDGVVIMILEYGVVSALKSRNFNACGWTLNNS